MMRVLILLALGAAVLLRTPERRERFAEWAKDASDVAVAFLLRATSQFGSELTGEGLGEQQRWREYRERDVRVRGKAGRSL